MSEENLIALICGLSGLYFFIGAMFCFFYDKAQGQTLFMTFGEWLFLVFTWPVGVFYLIVKIWSKKQ